MRSFIGACGELQVGPRRRGADRTAGGIVPSVQVKGPPRGALVRIFFGAAHGFPELFFEEAVAVLHGGDLALEDVLGPGLVLVEPLEQGVQVLAAGDGLFGLAVGEDLPGLGVDDEVRIAIWAADGQLPGLAHS